MKQDSIDKNMQERVGNLFKMFMYLIWHLEKGKAPCVDRLSRWHADKEEDAMSATEELFGQVFKFYHAFFFKLYYLALFLFKLYSLDGFSSSNRQKKRTYGPYYGVFLVAK